MTAADPPGSRQAAEGLVLICEDWLRRLARDGEPIPGPAVRAGLALAAAGAPRLAACCPELMRAIGPRVAHWVTEQAIAQAASEVAAAASGGAVWISAAQAGRVLSIEADSVRWLLRRGLISGRRAERGWRVDARSLPAYAGRRRDGRRAAVH
jgi:hypothetical protein